MARTLAPHQLIERSIIKKYRKELWNPFIAAVKRYELIQDGDKIAACVSAARTPCSWPNYFRNCTNTATFPLT